MGTIFNPYFSIIIPIYNAEKYLNRCIASIKNQSFVDYEVILVDDGSTDSSSDICKKYVAEADRYKYFFKENGGSFQARRFGVGKASGEYLMFIDADDFYSREDALLILYNELKDEKLGAIQFGSLKQYNHLRRNGPKVTDAFTLDSNDFKNHEYPKLVCSFYDNSHLTVNVWNKVYHRRLLENLPDFHDEGRIFMGDDQIMNLYLLENCWSFRFIPEILYCYQQGSGGTSKFSKTTMYDLATIKRYQLQFLERYDYVNREQIEKTLYSELAGWFYVYIQESIEHLNDSEIINLIEESLKLDTFVIAREYYLQNSAEKWEAVDLLRKANPDEYLQSAKNNRRKSCLKRKARKILKWMYSAL